MRALSLIIASLLIATAASAQTALIGESDAARPGGTYTTLATPDVAACARLCTDDSICMAWTYRGNACELKAVAPPSVAETGSRSGLSQRAPAFLRQVSASTPEDGSSPPTTSRIASSIVLSTAPVAAGDAVLNDELLGGLEGQGLRPRMGEQPAP